ncbi:MAG: NAD-dependent epimerase/dehydratase family protein [Polyangiaceae bacterium]
MSERPNAAQGSVIVTGACGRLGRALVRMLHRELDVVVLDRREALGFPADVEHQQLDLRSKRVREVFRRDVKALIHLGVMHDPNRSPEEHHTFNVLSAQQLFECAEQFQVPKVVVLSSANVYGPRPENPQLLTEEAPLLAGGRFSDIRDLVELDMSAQSFLWRNPATETVILRPSHILGTVHNAPSNYLRMKRVPTLLGFDPMVQVVHQLDLVRALRLALKPGARGVFNIAGPPPVSLSRALELLGRAPMPIPHGAARFVMDRLFRWRVSSFPAPELDFIRYVCMVDDSCARRVLNYAPEYDLAETLRAVDAERWVD